MTTSKNDFSWDIFICYDDKDLKDIARPLYDALRNKRIKAWLYEESMKGTGDSIIRELHTGIMNSKSSVFIVTQNFLKNDRYASDELDMIFTKRAILGNKLIFAIWHGVTSKEVALYNLKLASVDGIRWESGIDEVSDELIFRMRRGLSNG